MRFIQKNLLLLSILVLGFVLRIGAIFADPFLHAWDERFHALVARNMMDNPFVPILRMHPITENYDKFMWCCNHIWLHKQPLFMWQMALSMKVFGVSEWSMRLPSALMGTLLILIAYRIAILMQVRKSVALIATLLLACSNFHLRIIGGIHGMDHNDVAHGFYVLASIWALFEYQKSKKWYWFIAIGVFSGAAILVKWLTGLLVYLMWGVLLAIALKHKKSIKDQILPMVYSLIVCCIVFLPWQIYIITRFPELAAYEYEFNRRHITEALEGNDGDYIYYLGYVKNLFGQLLYLLVPIGMIMSVKNKSILQNLNWSIIIAFWFVFFFFSIIVKTKVDTYLFFVVPLANIYIALTIDYFLRWSGKKIKPIFATTIILLTCTLLTMDPQWTVKYFSAENTSRNERIHNATIYKELYKDLPDSVKVVMNMNSFEDIDVMFYNKGITAYHWTVPEEDLKTLELRKIPIAVYESHGNYNLPEYVLKYPYLHIIKKKLKDF